MKSHPQIETNPIGNGHVPNGNIISNSHTNGYIHKGNVQNGSIPNGTSSNGFLPKANGSIPNGTMHIHDLEAEPIQTVSKMVSNGTLANGVSHMANGHAKVGQVANGYAGRGVPRYNEIDGHI